MSVDNWFGLFFFVQRGGLGVIDDAEEVVHLFEEQGGLGCGHRSEGVSEYKFVSFKSFGDGNGCVEVVEHSGLRIFIDGLKPFIGLRVVEVFGIDSVGGNSGEGFLEPFDVALGIAQGLASEVVRLVVRHADEREAQSERAKSLFEDVTGREEIAF